MEIFNEGCVLMQSYCFTACVDHYDMEPEIKHKYGWVLVAFPVLYITVNVGIMVIRALIGIY